MRVHVEYSLMVRSRRWIVSSIGCNLTWPVGSGESAAVTAFWLEVASEGTARQPFFTYRRHLSVAEFAKNHMDSDAGPPEYHQQQRERLLIIYSSVVSLLLKSSFLLHRDFNLISFRQNERLTLSRLRWFLTASDRRERTSTSTEKEPMYWNNV